MCCHTADIRGSRKITSKISNVCQMSRQRKFFDTRQMFIGTCNCLQNANTLQMKVPSIKSEKKMYSISYGVTLLNVVGARPQVTGASFPRTRTCCMRGKGTIIAQRASSALACASQGALAFSPTALNKETEGAPEHSRKTNKKKTAGQKKS